jgi:hypothetical protein
MSIRIEPQELFGWLQAESVAYVVLRDCDLVHSDRLSRLDDVDLLVDDAAIPALMNRFANKSGPLKLDIYGIAGEHGTGYHGTAHLPEALARSLIEHRTIRDGVSIPAATDELNALLYHIVYHKSVQSGLHSGDDKLSAENDYTRRVRALLAATGQALELTLGAFHDHLTAQGYGVSEERLIAYLQHDFHHGRKSYFHALLQDRHPGELNLFVIREVALKHQCEDQLLERLRQCYEIVTCKSIPWLTRWRTRRHMRGGKWRRGGKPHLAIVVFDPKPEPSSPAERNVHPFVFNRNQFVKVEWRDWFIAHSGARPKDNPIHSTDNEAEAFGHLPLFFNVIEQADILRRVRSLRNEVAL